MDKCGGLYQHTLYKYYTSNIALNQPCYSLYTDHTLFFKIERQQS